jgi:hypothetical protein
MSHQRYKNAHVQIDHRLLEIECGVHIVTAALIHEYLPECDAPSCVSKLLAC